MAIQITSDGKIKLFTDGQVQLVGTCHPEALTIVASFSGVESCGCIGGGSTYFKLNPAVINGATLTLHRTVAFGDLAQWESNYPVGSVLAGVLEKYNPVDTGPCLEIYEECRGDEVGGCDGDFGPCIAECGGDPGCEDDCFETLTLCRQTCFQAVPVCMDCNYWGDGQHDELRSCFCYELEGCIGGAHLVVQCIIPNPDFPDTVSNVEMWINKVVQSGTAGYLSCLNACGVTWAACMDACEGDGSCENDCSNDANACYSDCEPFGRSCGGGAGDIPVFRWRDVDRTGLFGTNDSDLTTGGCGSTQFGAAGAVTLTIDNPAP